MPGETGHLAPYRWRKSLPTREEHIDYLETQLELMDKLGEELYSAQCVSPTDLMPGEDSPIPSRRR